MKVNWSTVIATVIFTATLGLAVGWKWALIPAGLAYVGTLVTKR